ncbi:NUDIX domain-containing protein [Streptomyces sp. NPDC058206]|uniref:NUDIX domain-containing protein n=1 Tax=Streptomyces sp. NPDC058206 TaxID=3346382 RepID=UPI0036ECBBAA
MTESTRLPSSLATWVESVLGPLDCVRDASHARDNSQVWRVTGRVGDHYVKVAPKPILYTRETCAYRMAVPHLGHGNAPVLQDSSAELLALVLTAVDGEPLKEEESPVTVVGGHLEAGEAFDRAARREAKEEAVVRISADQQEFCGLIHHHEPGDGLDRITAVFVAQSWTGKPHNAEPDKHEGLFWVPMEKPPPDCHPYTTHIFHMLTHGPSYRALNWPTQGGSE